MNPIPLIWSGVKGINIIKKAPSDWVIGRLDKCGSVCLRSFFCSGSGVVVCYLLYLLFVASRTGPVADFIIDRFGRIYPVVTDFNLFAHTALCNHFVPLVGVA